MHDREVKNVLWQLIRLGLASLLVCSASFGEEGLLPGELPVDFGRELIGRSKFPTLRELVQIINKPEHVPALLFRFYGDQHNYYAPAWSRNGYALAALRSDIEAHTSKIVVFSNLKAQTAEIVYEAKPSYDHMIAWDVSGKPIFAFASTNERGRNENIHFGEIRGIKLYGYRVTKGPEPKRHPSLWLGNSPALLYASENKVISAGIASRSLQITEGKTIGTGNEACWSADGEWFLWVRRLYISETYSKEWLIAARRHLNLQLRIFSREDTLIRNPTWSPSGRYVAFYLRKSNEPGWKLATLRLPGSLDKRDTGPKQEEAELPLAVIARVKAQEHFRNFGPTWDPRGDRLWYFTTTGEQEYYPLHWSSADGGTKGVVHYPSSLSAATDVAVNPNPKIRAIAFCAVRDLSQEIFIIVPNH